MKCFSISQPFSSYNKFYASLGILDLFFSQLSFLQYRVFIKFHLVALFLQLALYPALSFFFKFKLMLCVLTFTFIFRTLKPVFRLIFLNFYQLLLLPGNRNCIHCFLKFYTYHIIQDALVISQTFVFNITWLWIA